MKPAGTSPDAYGMRPGWPNCAKCGNRWDDLLVFLTNCPKCGAAIPDAPLANQRPAKEQPGEVAAMVKRLREALPRLNDAALSSYAKHRTHLHECLPLLRDAAALIEKLGQGWIPVSERLPEVAR